MHNGMRQAIIVELVCGVLLFTFDGGFVAFWHGAKGVVIIFHTRSTSHFHELMISLVTHRITPAPSVSPPPTPRPASLDPMVVLFPWEPPERSNSPLPWPNWETNPFRGEPQDEIPVPESQPNHDFNMTIVPPGVPFHIPCLICQGSIERSEIHQHGERDIIRQGSDVDLMTHQFHPFIITRVLRNHPLRNQQARSPIIPPSFYQERPPPSYIDSWNDQLLPNPVALHLAESLDIPNAESRVTLPAITHTIYSLTRANCLFQPEDSSASGHTVAPTFTNPTVAQPRVNGASSRDTTSSSTPHQFRPSLHPRQSGWWAVGDNGLRTRQVPGQEPAWDIPMGSRLPGEGSTQASRDRPASSLHRWRQQLLHGNIPRPSTPPPTPATIQGDNGNWDRPLMPLPDEPWEGLSVTTDAPANGSGASSGSMNSNTFLDPSWWDWSRDLHLCP